MFFYHDEENELKDKLEFAEIRIRSLEGEVKELQNEEIENNSRIRIKEQEIAMEISKASAKLTAEINQLKQTVAVTEKENDILTHAFENMGFDVKDMKAILDKLVDGIVAKSANGAVQIIK